jgi:hypothetical protein
VTVRFAIVCDSRRILSQTEVTKRGSSARALGDPTRLVTPLLCHSSQGGQRCWTGAMRTSENTPSAQPGDSWECARAPMFSPLLPEKPYRASSRSKRTSRAPSPSMAWKPRAGSFVFLELHPIPVPADFMTPHIYPSMLHAAVPSAPDDFLFISCLKSSALGNHSFG